MFCGEAGEAVASCQETLLRTSRSQSGQANYMQINLTRFFFFYIIYFLGARHAIFKLSLKTIVILVWTQCVIARQSCRN